MLAALLLVGLMVLEARTTGCEAAARSREAADQYWQAGENNPDPVQRARWRGLAEKHRRAADRHVRWVHPLAQACTRGGKRR